MYGDIAAQDLPCCTDSSDISPVDAKEHSNTVTYAALWTLMAVHSHVYAQ